MLRARIYKSSKRDFECRTEDTGEMVIARAPANLLKNNESLVVGDYVIITKSDAVDEYEIKEREARKSEIYRLIVRESKKKVTAANVDLIVILTSISRPAYKQGLIDRFLVRAVQWGIKPIVVINKMDEYDPGEVDLNFEIERLKQLKVPVFCISAKYPEKNFVDESMNFKALKNIIASKTAIFLGQSGVGKSKTISELSGGQFELKTHEIGRAGKGSHTTTWSEIVSFSHFELIDSPGIRSFSLEDIDPELLIEYFPDLQEIALECKFQNCQHKSNSKGCRFYMEEVYANQLAKDVTLSRLDIYHRIFEEISHIPHWQKKK